MQNNLTALYAMGIFKFRGGLSNEEDDRGKPKKWYYSVWILATIALVFISINLYKKNRFYEVEKTHFGTITYAPYEEPRKDKHGTTIEIQKYIIVKFDSVEKPFEILVSPDTYYSSYKGRRVCFDLANRDIYQKIYPRKFSVYVFMSAFSIAYIIGYISFFFLFAVPLIKYILGKDSSMYKH